MLVKLLHLHVYTSFICMAHSFIISTEKKKTRSTHILCTALTQDFTKSLPKHSKWQVSFLMYNHIPWSSSFSFFAINEAAKEENNQRHQGYATQNSSTNDSSSINRRGVFTCNNQNGKKKSELIFCACVQRVKQWDPSVRSVLISQSGHQSVDPSASQCVPEVSLFCAFPALP